MNLEKEIFEISLNDIMPNRFQPREIFDNDALDELSQSIREHGVIQPIIVRKVGDKYEIVAGERRYRASLLAGKQTIPAIVKDIDDKETAKIALLENLQRKDLTPIEEARTYQTILKLDNLTQDELAISLGKSQSTIANKLRLLNLADEVQTALLNQKISERHARSLLNLEDKNKQKELLEKVLINRMTVKQLDDEIAILTGNKIVTEEPVQEAPIQQAQTINIPDSNIPQVTAQPPAENNIIENTAQVPVQNNISNNIQKEEPVSMNEPIFEIPKTEQTEMKTENIFDRLRVGQTTNNETINNTVIPKIEEVTPDGPVIGSVNTPSQPEYSNIYDLRFAINNVRQAVQNTEKFGFSIKTEEFDFENMYQIVIKIDKNK